MEGSATCHGEDVDPKSTSEKSSKANNSVTEGKFDDSATNIYARRGNHYLVHPSSGVHDFAVEKSPGEENANVHHSEPDDECLGGPELPKHASGDKKAASGSTIIKLFASEDK